MERGLDSSRWATAARITAHALAGWCAQRERRKLSLGRGNRGVTRCATTVYTTSKRGLRKSAIS